MNLQEITQPKSEADVQRLLIDRLSRFAMVIRVNGGLLHSGKHWSYAVKCPISGLDEHKGLPDLLVVLRSGTTVFIECKGLSTSATNAQLEFREVCKQMGIVHFISRPNTVYQHIKVISDMAGIGVNFNVH